MLPIAGAASLRRLGRDRQCAHALVPRRVVSLWLLAGRWDDEAEVLKAFWIYQDIDPGDLSVGDGERHHGEHPPGGGYHGSCGAIDEHWPDERGKPGVGRGVGRYGLRAAEGQRCLLAPHAAVDPQFHAGIEHRDQGAEVAIARGSEERVHYLALPGEVRVGGEAGLRAVPGPAGVPGVCAADPGTARRVGRAERAGTAADLGTR